MSKNALERIRSLFKAYTGPEDKGFAADYRSAVSEGTRTRQLSPEQITALDKVRAAIERWNQGDDHGEAPSNPIEEWLQLVEATKGHLPKELIELALSRVPARRLESIDWTPLVLERNDRDLLRVMLEQKVLRLSAIVALAKAEPSRFYESVALDVLLENEGVPPRAVWSALEEKPNRGAGLGSGPEALAEAFALDSANDAPMWLTEFLAASPKTRSAVLLQILRDPAAVERLARYFSGVGSGLKGKKRDQALETAAQVLGDFVELCAQAVESEKRTSGVAAWAVSIIALGAHSPVVPFPPGLAKTVNEGLGRIARPRLLSMLRRADDQSITNSALLTATDAQVYGAVQGYLQALPSGGGGEGAPAERAARYQRFLGRKEVMQELIPLLEDAESDAVPRAALAAVLFNMGLRPLGVTEGTDTFDAHRHEPKAPGIIPGESVRIVRPGWQIGDDESPLVLEKAHVAPRE